MQTQPKLTNYLRITEVFLHFPKIQKTQKPKHCAKLTLINQKMANRHLKSKFKKSIITEKTGGGGVGICFRTEGEHFDKTWEKGILANRPKTIF